MQKTPDFDFQYETPRLLLKVLSEADGEKVLNFHTKNAAVFEQFEPKRPDQFYTLRYQKALLSAEFNMLLQKSCVRFWLFERQNPDIVIGTISFNFIVNAPFNSCQIGYKLDPDYWNMGYATEALGMAIAITSTVLNIHRIEAFVLPNNLPSIKLLEKLHFEREGLAKRAIFLNGAWTDHYRYALVIES